MRLNFVGCHGNVENQEISSKNFERGQSSQREFENQKQEMKTQFEQLQIQTKALHTKEDQLKVFFFFFFVGDFLFRRKRVPFERMSNLKTKIKQIR